jgi:branched-chain amino acid transport system substrate-binding protein
MVNEAGGVGGRTIEFIHYDDEFNAAQGLTYAQRLVEDDQIFAFVGHFGTPTVGATLEYLNTIGIPRVYYATGVSDLFVPEAKGGERASFPVQPIYDAEGQVMVARAVADLGATKIGVIYTNADDGRGLLRGVELQAKELGVELVTAQVAPDVNDMSSAAQTIMGGGVDTVIVAANQVPADVAIKALAAAGNSSPVVTSYVNAAATFISGIQEVLGSFDVYANAWIDLYDEAGEFSEGYVKYSEEISKVDPALAGNAFAMAGWVAASAFVQGLERVGTDPLTWGNYINAMESAPVQNPLGGIVDYSGGSRVGTQAMSLLKASFEDETPEWLTFKPLQDINKILGK